MTSSISASFNMNWQEQAHQYLTEGKYSEVASLYEQAIVAEPGVISHYWYLGLAYLLQSYEEEAQVTWMSVMVEGTPEEVEEWTEELIQILEVEANRQTNLDNLKLSWLIRQHIREIAPTFVNNLLHLIQVSIDLGDFTPERLTQWQVATFLHQSDSEQVDSTLLLQVLKNSLEFPSPETLAFVEASLPYYSDNSGIFIDSLMLTAVKVAYKTQKPLFAASIAELCLKLNPIHTEALRHLSCFYTSARLYQQAIETARRFFNNCLNTLWQVQGSSLMLLTLLRSGAWLEAKPVLQNHKFLVRDLVQNPPENIEPGYASHLLISNFFLPYLEDKPQENRWLQNQVAQLFQNSFQTAHSAFMELPWSNNLEAARPLKIGYIAHTLKNHSVGWLSRWLFQHYDRQAFQTNLYLIYQNLEDTQWFRDRVDGVYDFSPDSHAIASKIKEDEIDILVDLDSLTLDATCQVMALKPAPLQVTWLGWDASGIPAIDYYNGATTTLETLWVGVPLVTRVGQQFSARNSYTFMMNVGVTEGIAWTDEEYVEWGVRLGKDPALRQQVAWKLRQSRQTSPLWNAKQFTQEMEKAYKQMWKNYLEARDN